MNHCHIPGSSTVNFTVRIFAEGFQCRKVAEIVHDNQHGHYDQKNQNDYRHCDYALCTGYPCRNNDCHADNKSAQKCKTCTDHSDDHICLPQAESRAGHFFFLRACCDHGHPQAEAKQQLRNARNQVRHDRAASQPGNNIKHTVHITGHLCREVYV